MVLARLQQVELAFGDHVLLDKVDLDVQENERLCVVGRNGEGKSTLLKILSGDVLPDDGVVQYRDMLRIAVLQQELPKGVDRPVYDVIAEGLGDIGEVISQYHDETAKGEHADMALLESLQARIEAVDGWSWQQKVEAIIQKLKLPQDSRFNEL
jgi:ATP-binding cassette subfamily F protein uup